MTMLIWRRVGEAKWWKWSEGTVQLGRGNDDGNDYLDAIKTAFDNFAMGGKVFFFGHLSPDDIEVRARMGLGCDTQMHK